MSAMSPPMMHNHEAWKDTWANPCGGSAMATGDMAATMASMATMPGAQEWLQALGWGEAADQTTVLAQWAPQLYAEIDHLQRRVRELEEWQRQALDDMQVLRREHQRLRDSVKEAKRTPLCDSSSATIGGPMMVVSSPLLSSTTGAAAAVPGTSLLLSSSGGSSPARSGCESGRSFSTTAKAFSPRSSPLLSPCTLGDAGSFRLDIEAAVAAAARSASRSTPATGAPTDAAMTVGRIETPPAQTTTSTGFAEHRPVSTPVVGSPLAGSSPRTGLSVSPPGSSPLLGSLCISPLGLSDFKFDRGPQKLKEPTNNILSLSQLVGPTDRNGGGANALLLGGPPVGGTNGFLNYTEQLSERQSSSSDPALSPVASEGPLVAPPGLSPSPAKATDATSVPSNIREGILVINAEVNERDCIRAEWRIGNLRTKLCGCMGRPLVSPPFDAGTLSNLRMMVYPDSREVVKGLRSKKQKEQYATMVNNGPLHGALKFKASNLDSSVSVLTFYLTVGSSRRGPYTYNFTEHAVHGCADFGIDWLEEVDPESGCLCVAVEIEEVTSVAAAEAAGTLGHNTMDGARSP